MTVIEVSDFYLDSLWFKILTVIIYNSLIHFFRNVTRVLAMVMITLDGVANTSLFLFLQSSNNNNSTALVDRCTEYATSNTHTAGLVFVAHTVLIAIAMLTFW